ncbi:prenyltransferase/squalene oxidase repeat-containing protein [Sulfuriroseicoccus oceanibius]|uniref:Terpene cyclase/mutase family protein n=1 Tax=Sulfuriroseicoccus oceanibius TaxID=2707525 RepID=A0A6B3L0F5_9BACT|nr:prenyltransferase/squalene oxidase repeat-containing protein [Sulfuriroseicoccus oceanibius]QQL43852.1 terpene cyclase/mutase family protein [Sulfuriroseicoccus oceanibius]
MKTAITCAALAASLVALPITATAADNATAPQAAKMDKRLSLKLEIEQALNRGSSYLESTQAEDGSWSIQQLPALTAIALSAVMNNPARENPQTTPEFARKAYDFILANQQEDGGIYVKGMNVYNTALSVMALLAEPTDKYKEQTLKATRYIVAQQSDFDTIGETDSPYDGGIGYGGTYPHSDLSNTHFALEALSHTRQRFQDEGDDAAKELNWDAAIQFVSRTQNLEETNDQEFASSDPDNRGGFVYFPGDSKAGEQELPNGRTALRSYGSMSYAGLLSFIYAEVDKDDPRVKAVTDWVTKNYTIEENPNMGAQGLFYYFHTMSKGLTKAGIDTIQTADGTKIDWKKDLALKVLSLQKPNGSWTNDASNRWMEDNPTLSTAYMMLTLEHIYHSL